MWVASRAHRSYRLGAVTCLALLLGSALGETARAAELDTAATAAANSQTAPNPNLPPPVEEPEDAVEPASRGGMAPAPSPQAPLPTSAGAGTPDVTAGASAVPAPLPAAPTPPPTPAFVPPSPALNREWAWVDTVPTPTVVDDEPPKRSAYRGSRFDWTHSATTTLLGVGADYQSAAYQIYRQGYTLLLNYFFYDGETIRLRLTTAPGLDVEMTDSDITTTRREPWFRDLPVAVGLTAPLIRDDTRLLSSIFGANLVFVAPTSKVSRASGHYLTVSPRVNWTQQLPLRGARASVLDDVEFWVQLRYDHLFSRAATPVDTDLNVPRRTGGASAPGTLSDVLNGSQIAPNGIRIEGSAAFNETLLGRPLTLSISADYSAWVLAGVTRAPATPATSEIGADPDARTVRQLVGIGADLTWQVVNAMSLSVGYGNTADLDNVPSNNPLYTPYAAFLAGLVVHVDTVLESLINRDKQQSPLNRRDLARNLAPGRSAEHW